MKAPKKRDETFPDQCRKERAYDPDNLTLSVRAFKLDGASDGEDRSTENSSPEGSQERDHALIEMRGQWSAFSNRIMNIQIPSKGPLRL